MALAAGTRLGPYEILEPLGAGGMGEVYRARDTRLDRTVAVKVLPSDLSSNPRLRQRLEREARAVSRLSHPHICTLHDVGREAGVDFLVMEYLEGETLAGRLREGRLPLEQTLRYATEIAAALDTAHRHGVVHRDLKPGNVMLTKSGAKLLDFGLAKLREPGSGGNGESASAAPTLDRTLTDEGTIPGTYPYMAPEQLEGKPTDARTDLFAFGAMLYEMVTGKRAFEGESRASLVAAILDHAPPPVSTLEPFSPPGLDHVVQTCLAKDPDDRWQSAHDITTELRWITEGGSRAGLLLALRRPRWRKRASLLGVVGLLAVGGGLGWWFLSSRTSDTMPPMKITPFTADGGYKGRPRFSPDGEKVAYEWTGLSDDNWDIYVKALGVGAKPFRLTKHPAHEWSPVWSPDGRQIAFVRWTDDAAALYTVPSLGGQEHKLIDLRAPAYYPILAFVPILSWSPDGEGLAFPEKDDESAPARIVRLSLATLEKQALTSPPLVSFGDLSPSISPDGRHLAFVRSGNVWVQPLGGGHARRLTSGGYTHCRGLAWAADGNEIFYCHTVAGIALGISRISLAGGEPQPLAGVGPNACWPTIGGGRMAYGQLLWRPWDIWRAPGRKALLPDRAPEKLIGSSQPDYNPDYSPDGRKIAFASDRSGVPNIWVCESDGSSPVQLTDFKTFAGTPRWSPDGRKIVFDSSEGGNWDLHVVDAEGGTPWRLTPKGTWEVRGSWSRDGRWVYFVSDREGRHQTWKMPAEGGPATQVTQGGGNYARESWDGRHLYYTKGPLTGIWRVPVDGGEEIEVVSGPIGYFWDWALSRTGIYFATIRHVIPLRRQEYSIQFLDFESGEVTEQFRKEGLFEYGSLAVSPDEQWILYGKSPARESELMLVENFR